MVDISDIMMFTVIVTFVFSLGRAPWNLPSNQMSPGGQPSFLTDKITITDDTGIISVKILNYFADPT